MSVFLTCVLIFSALAVALTFIDLGGEIIRRFRSRRERSSMMGPKSAPLSRPSCASKPGLGSLGARVVE